MNKSDSKVYFISGANRGIGFSLVKELQNKGIIFATARVPEKADALNELARKNKNIHVIKLDAASKESNEIAAKKVAKVTDKVDTLIVNAGIAETPRQIGDIDEGYLDRHFKTNVYGSIFTFQSIYPLLKNSSEKEVAFISSRAGSILEITPVPTGAYGLSKAALSKFIRHLHLQLKSEGFKVIAIHPGLVSTDMGNRGVERLKKMINLEDYGIVVTTPEECASQIANLLSSLDSSKNGKFLDYKGEETPW